ncbi:hypothetical protein V6N11_009417 [Hibiscus sabdariffa]|uniref:Uncharacterized protein n=1 Tax=Hibiscus sabdariffa TaxID=183260 RepID=A0ABR2NST2_9ROSI
MVRLLASLMIYGFQLWGLCALMSWKTLKSCHAYLSRISWMSLIEKCMKGDDISLDSPRSNKLVGAIAKLDTSYDLFLFVDPPVPLLPLLASDSSSSM